MNTGTIQLGELCDLVQAKPREARYVLEQGYVPQGTASNPSTGVHRQFGPGQSFWLATVLKLKQSGINVPTAAKIADYGTDQLRVVTQNLGWDWRFRPSKGEFDTEEQHVLEVGDMEYVRLCTTSRPGDDGLYPPDWSRVHRPGKPVLGVVPFVTIQIDMSRIAQALSANDWSI